MEKRAAIVQSNYIPWKGYFDLIGRVDEFILYDDVQYTRRDWRNRNLIKTPAGLRWLTIPVEVSGKYLQKILETRVADMGWARTHWSMLRQYYSKARCFSDCRSWLEPLYLDCEERLLSRINHRFISAICTYLDIRTRISWSSDYEVGGDRNGRLIALCERVGATCYVSGPAARDYLDQSAFRAAGIAVEWMDYSGYREYPQLHGGFAHGVSVLDLLFNTGPDARSYLGRSREMNAG